jgi:hypothetical protein
MSCRSPRNVIVVNRVRAPFAAYYESLPIGPGYLIVAKVERMQFALHGESLPIGRAYRFVDTPQLCSGVTLSRGKGRNREGT